MVYHILCYSLTTLLTALFLGCTSRKKKGSVRAGNGSDGIESRPLAELEECDDSGGACKHCGDKKRERDATGSKDFIDGSVNRGRRRPSKNRDKNCKRKHRSARREDYAKEKNWSGEVMKISDDSDSMAKRKNHGARDAHQYSNESSRSGRRPLGALSDDEQPSESARIKRGTYEKYGSRDTTDYKSREPTGGYGKRTRRKDRRQPGEALGGTTDLMQSRNTTNDIQMSADRITRSSDANRTSRKEVLRSIEHMHSNERLNSKQSFLQPEKGNNAPDDDQSVSEMKRETKNKTLEDQTNGGDRVLHTSYDVIKEKDKREKRRRSRKKSCGVKDDEKGYKRGGESDPPRKKRGDKAHGRLERIPEVLEYSDSKDDPREPVHSRPQRKQHPKQSKKPRKRSSKKKEKSRKEKKANPDRMKSIEHMNSNFNLLSKEQMKEGEPAKLFENARLICDKNGYCELRQLNNLGEKFNEAALQKVSVTTNEHEISKKGEKKKKEKETETEKKEEKEQVAETCPDEDDKANYFMIVDPPSSNRAIRQDQVAEELSPNGYIDLWKDGEVKEIPRRGSK